MHGWHTVGLMPQRGALEVQKCEQPAAVASLSRRPIHRCEAGYQEEVCMHVTHEREHTAWSSLRDTRHRMHRCIKYNVYACDACVAGSLKHFATVAYHSSRISKCLDEL